jgi:DNA polymerase (family 10)
MARAAIRLGYDWLVISDHSYGLPVTQGLTIEKALRQRREVEALNRELAPFRILHGVELEIGRDGSLDFDDAFLASFDIVGASLHMPSRDGDEQNTSRLLLAMGHPPVMGINHPTGGIVGRRDPYGVDMTRVIQAAAASGRTLEINGNERLDLSSGLARQARDLGVHFTLSSDAHSADGLHAMRYAVALARRAWLEPRHVVNTLSADALLARYGAGRQQRRAA